jgi:hypothetical protein
LIIYFDETNICSAELLESKFIVPCNPEKYLSFQYGNKWRMPLQNDYFNYGSIGFYKIWSDEEWPYVIRWYNMNNGSFDYAKSLRDTNNYAKVAYKELPSGTL